MTSGEPQTLELDDFIIKKYEIKKRIGKGAYGIVWKACERKSKKVVALKKIFDAFTNQTDAQRTYREIMFLKAFSGHPNVIRLLGVHSALNYKDIYLVFEYMDTDLHRVILSKDILKDVHKRYIMYQLLKATLFLHSGNVIHRDQKPSNILIDTNCTCKIADFGLARSLSQLSDTPVGHGDLTDYVATRWYRAPEILVGSTCYTKGIDMWSLGCILAEMLLEKPVFPGPSSIQQLQLISQTLPPPTKEDMKIFAGTYGSKLFSQKPPGKHATLDEILREAPSDAVDLVKKLLVLNPLKRLTAAEALKHDYVAKFHAIDSEPVLCNPVTPPLNDNVMLSVDEYRSKLYELAVAPSAASGSRHHASRSRRQHQTPQQQSNPSKNQLRPTATEPKQVASRPRPATQASLASYSTAEARRNSLQKKDSSSNLASSGMGAGGENFSKTTAKKMERKSSLPILSSVSAAAAASSNNKCLMPASKTVSSGLAHPSTTSQPLSGQDKPKLRRTSTPGGTQATKASISGQRQWWY
ncbi:Hypothetical predicted protein [Cloeon dipterum]|uniref:Protein kinase domain-containing protein n=1 Tax=Cloeon dipterum TaxID=197152 RepID=A0A8S1C1T2_9INSE|nr:Hypothetical predicted protein [Cloeon dipterum]